MYQKKTVLALESFWLKNVIFFQSEEVFSEKISKILKLLKSVQNDLWVIIRTVLSSTKTETSIQFSGTSYTTTAGCYNTSQRCSIADWMFAISHRKCWLKSAYLSKDLSILYSVYHYVEYFLFLCFNFFEFICNLITWYFHKTKFLIPNFR